MKAIVGLVAALSAVMVGTALSGGAQVARAETLSFTVQLAGANEVPAVTSGGSGSAEFTFDTESNELSYVVVVRGISQSEVTAAHIHRGAAGETGPVAYTLSDVGFLQLVGSVALSDEDVEALAAGALYLNVHSEEYPDGFARGQLTAAELMESEDEAEASPTPDGPAPVVPGAPEAGTEILPPNTGDAGLRNDGGAGEFLPVAVLLVLFGATSSLLLIRSRA